MILFHDLIFRIHRRGMIILLKIRKSLFLFLNEDYRHGKKRRGWRTMSTESFENCGNVWYLEEYLLMFCVKTLYIEKNIKYIYGL